MNCDFDDSLQCRVCGYRARRPGTRRTCDLYGPPAEPSPVELWGVGVGAELHKLLDRIGVPLPTDCGCVDFARQMNEWGAAGCRKRRSEIVQRLRERRGAEPWHVLAAITTRALLSPVGWQVDVLDPLGSLVDLAIRNAEAAPVAAAR